MMSLDWSAGNSAECIAWQEGGHAAGYWSQGIPFTDVTIKGHGPSSGRIPSAIAKAVPKRGSVCMFGAVPVGGAHAATRMMPIAASPRPVR
jgi:hypothetical protein